MDLALFSPPYDQVRDYGGDWALDLPQLGAELLRVVRDGGVCVVVIQDGTKDFAKSLSSFRLAVNWCDEVGWRLFECCIYQRDGRPGAWWRGRFRVDHEYILLFLKGGRPRYFDSEHLRIPSKHGNATWSGSQRKSDGSMERVVDAPIHALKCRGTIWKYATSNSESNRLKLQHPATYPGRLAEDLVRCFSPPGGVVLDPMAGSGTTCVAAQRWGRRFVGMDINGEYCEIARRRLETEPVVVL